MNGENVDSKAGDNIVSMSGDQLHVHQVCEEYGKT
jgi:hypothetical protein